MDDSLFTLTFSTRPMRFFYETAPNPPKAKECQLRKVRRTRAAPLAATVEMGHSQRTSALEGKGGVWPMRTLVDVGRGKGIFAAADVLF